MFSNKYARIYTGHTQNNGAVLIVNTIKTAPFFCVCPVYIYVVPPPECCYRTAQFSEAGPIGSDR